MDLGEHLYRLIGEPEQVDLYGIGFGQEPNRNEEQFDTLTRQLEQYADVTPVRFAAEDYERDDVLQNDALDTVYRTGKDTAAVLMVPDTLTLQKGAGGPIERYRNVIDMTAEQGLDAVLHTHAAADLEHMWPDDDVAALLANVEQTYRDQNQTFYGHTVEWSTFDDTLALTSRQRLDSSHLQKD